MELEFHQIIKGVVLTTKSTELFKKQGKIVFKIHRSANKNMVKNAVEKIWNVKVDNVNVINTVGKQRRFGGKTYRSSRKKKAIISLKKGHKINLPGQFEATEMSSRQKGTELKEK